MSISYFSFHEKVRNKRGKVRKIDTPITGKTYVSDIIWYDRFGWEELNCMNYTQSFIDKNYIQPVEPEVPDDEMKVADFPDLGEDMSNIFNNTMEDY